MFLLIRRSESSNRNDMLFNCKKMKQMWINTPATGTNELMLNFGNKQHFCIYIETVESVVSAKTVFDKVMNALLSNPNGAIAVHTDGTVEVLSGGGML